MILIIILLTLSLYSSPVQAQEFVPYQNNPIVLKDPTHNGAVMPSVLKEDNTYSLWYADDAGTSFRIYNMKSANGIDWYDKTDTNVTNRHNASDPFVTKENNIYTLYFASSNYGNISLWESKSEDGLHYMQGSEREILKSEMTWEGEHLSCPAVLKDNGLYYLFYAGSGVSNWGIGVATSPDGTNWEKCPNNPIIAPGASGQVVKYNDNFYLYFQTPNGLEVQQATSLNGCSTQWTGRHIVNSALRDPSPLQVGNDLWMYGTLPTSTGLHIGLASNNVIAPPTYPIVIVPGMFASWNKDAILHNSTVAYDSWNLNPAVTEYNAIETTLNNKGKQKNTDYFEFAYDWRAPLLTTVENLKQFLNDKIWNKNPYQPVQLIGHSLGGTIARLFAQKNSEKPIKNIVTSGSPLLGTIQAYKPLMAGEIDRENSLMWIAEKLILLLNKSKIETDKETITRLLPVMSDLLPTFPYLKNTFESYVSSSIQNKTLINDPFSPLTNSLFMGATGQQMDAGYVLDQRTATDVLFNNYPDGHPQSSWQENGDGVILLKSTLNQITPVPNANHGQIIYSQDNIKTILSFLGISVQDADIPEGKGTSIFPAILAFIQSPAKINITHNGVMQNEDEGMIWVTNAESGEYTLNVNGTEVGEYTVSVWLIGAVDDKWFQFKKNSYIGSKNTFTITFDTTLGGNVTEYITPSPTLTPTPLPTKTPTPTIVLKPTCKPTIVVKHPTPTQKPHKPKKIEKKNYGYFIKILINKLRELFWRKTH